MKMLGGKDWTNLQVPGRKVKQTFIVWGIHIVRGETPASVDMVDASYTFVNIQFC